MNEFLRVRADVDMSAFVHNITEIENKTSEHAKVAAVIKTDGYGHGASQLASALEGREKIWGYCVATVEEAMKLRNDGFKKPILILGYTFSQQHDLLVANDIRPAVYSYDMAKSMSDQAAAQGKTAKIHIKLDTGMSRIGYQITEKSADEILEISKLPNLEIEGMFTHFAKADEYDKTFTREQYGRYMQMIDMIEERGINIPIKHVSNSAAIMEMTDYNLDMVRAGIIIYGLWPSDEVDKNALDLRPVISLKSHVVHVKTLDEGRTVSYGGTYRVEGEKVIATIPVGYGDGYPRLLSNKGYVLIKGCKAPICGRVCMDQFMVDVTDIPGVKVGDEVTLIGKDGDHEITVEELGALSGRFNYELVCDLGKRIPRRYI